jgi:hypothetical protein
MITCVYGDATRHGWAREFQRACWVVSRTSGIAGDLVDPAPVSLALMASMLRGDAGKRFERPVWRLRESGDSLIGDTMTPDELRALDEDTHTSAYMKKILDKEVRPSLVVIDPVEDWYHTMVQAYRSEDVQWALSVRETHINDSLYWLSVQAPIILIASQRLRQFRDRNCVYEANLPTCIERQVDVFIQVEEGRAYVSWKRDHVAIAPEPDGSISQEQCLEMFGYLSVGVSK